MLIPTYTTAEALAEADDPVILKAHVGRHPLDGVALFAASDAIKMAHDDVNRAAMLLAYSIVSARLDHASGQNSDIYTLPGDYMPSVEEMNLLGLIEASIQALRDLDSE